MKKNKFILLVLCLAMILQLPTLRVSAFPTDATDSEDGSVLNGCRTMDAQNALLGTGPLLDTARSAIMFDVYSNTMIYSWNPDLPIPPASLVKMMTTYVALLYGNLSDEVTITREMLDACSGQTMLQEGEILKLEDLLFCMMVPSDNGAATAVAQHVAGSQETFVKMMNEESQRIGCLSTNYVNAHGFHHAEQITTARDLGKFMLVALQHDLFREMFCSKYHILPETNMAGERYLMTTNYLISHDRTSMYFDPRFNGGKTASIESDKDEKNLIATAKNDSVYLLTIVLAAESIYEENSTDLKRAGNFQETIDLVDMAYEGYQECQIINDGMILRQYPVAGGDNYVAVGPDRECRILLPYGATKNDLTLELPNSLDFLSIPVEEGMRVGVVRVWYKNICIAQADLYTRNNVGEIIDHTGRQNQEKKDDGWGGTLQTFGILAGAVVLMGLMAVGVNYLKKAAHRKKIRRRRQDRRRSR